MADTIPPPEKPATAAPRPLRPRAGSGARRMSVVVLRDRAELAARQKEWDELAAAAAEPNPFYESWMLLPALDAFGPHAEDLRFVLIYAPHPSVETAPPILCGFFPLERRRRYKGLPVAALRLWEHLHCFLCVPLLRAGYAGECLAAFFDWLAVAKESCPLLEFNLVTGEGPFQQALVEQLRARASLTFVSDVYTRALLQPRASAAAYLAAACSGKRLKEFRRQEKRLAERGRMEYVALAPDGDIDASIESFLRLEASGWKGAQGTALAARERERAFFAAIVGEAFRRGRLLMLTMSLDGRPIAQKCNFLAGSGSFAFKIAFDETAAQFSPGVLLELENIRRIHQQPGIAWMDSCAQPDNFINTLWINRRTIQTLLCATGRRPGQFVVSALPLLRWFNRKLSFRNFTVSRRAAGAGARARERREGKSSGD